MFAFVGAQSHRNTSGRVDRPAMIQSLHIAAGRMSSGMFCAVSVAIDRNTIDAPMLGDVSDGLLDMREGYRSPETHGVFGLLACGCIVQDG
ncbi:hypothetical protein [Noviherbaspirillum cavernae]|uniref:hypothetical protein n=1 Tax=Noviherbaspirillum cavernae TaxID=2320862 RepID=UPI0018F76F38|nr:hypothetical protein [Noviherbaspirillum cavernae]